MGAVVYFDGQCGLCHWAVRFLLAEDKAGTLRFAPLQSEAFRSATTPEQRSTLGDTIVVRTAEGALLHRSAAMLYLAEGLGGRWRALALLGRGVPAPLRDAVYDGIAHIRHRLFARPEQTCPVVPPELRARFVDS